jgi:hypothetical protein
VIRFRQNLEQPVCKPPGGSQSGRSRQEFAASGLSPSQVAQQWRAEKQRRLRLSQAQKPAQ